MAYVNKTGSTRTDGYWTHRFSQTFLGGLQTCPEQARAKYEREISDDGHTDSTARGTAMHAGIESMLYDKKNGDPVDFVLAVDVARHELDEIGEWKYTKYSKVKCYESLVPLLSSFHEHILPEVDPLWLEHRFDVQLHKDDKREIRLVGAMDCVDQDYEVWDWKSASRSYEPWEKQRWAIQPTVYTHALHQERIASQYNFTPGDGFAVPMDATFHYGICFDDGSAQLLNVSRDDTHVEWLTTQAIQVAKMIERNRKGPWPLNDGGWWCSDKWCPKFDQCKGASMVDGWLKAPR